MGFAERDYYREPARPTGYGFGGVGVPVLSVTMWLIVINVAVFLLDQVVKGTEYVDTWYGTARVETHPITEWGLFSARTAIGHLQLWRFITFQFLHANLQHILFNMIALYFFGPLIERYLGAVRYLVFYLLCGIAGPISLLILAMFHVLQTSGNTALVGASAGIFGVLIAAAQVAPDSTVLIYGIIPARLRTVALVLLAVAIYTVFSNGANAGGEAAHLGGAAAGYWLIRNPRILGGVSGVVAGWGNRVRRKGVRR